MQNKKIALVFPGQGSQVPKMGLALYNNFNEARLVFEEVDEALGFSISKIIFEGTEEELKKTENTQVSLMAVSIACLKVIEKLTGKTVNTIASVLAGHSLGEYSALIAGGSISISEGSVILRKRGEFMAQAMPKGGAMLAIIGMEEQKVLELIEHAKGNEVLVIANDNATGQVVLSGNEGAILKAQSVAKEFGAKMAIKLEVSGPFHSPLLKKAEEQMREQLVNYNVSLPTIPTINNVNAEYYVTATEIKEILARQVTSRIRFRETILKMETDGITHAIELGSGKVLCGLFKRTCKNIQTANFGDPSEAESIISFIDK